MKKFNKKLRIKPRKKCKSKPHDIELTKLIETLYSKTPATTFTRYKLTAKVSEKIIQCSQISNGNKNRLNHKSFHQNKSEKLLHPNPEDCKN